MSINTERIFREGELDKGFVLRANDQVARQLREIIHRTKDDEMEDGDQQVKDKQLEILCILPERRLYGYIIIIVQYSLVCCSIKGSIWLLWLTFRVFQKLKKHQISEPSLSQTMFLRCFIFTTNLWTALKKRQQTRSLLLLEDFNL